MGSSSEEEQLYCICKSTAGDRFMIMCDHCDDWFHGDCVNIIEKESKYIKKYFCPECTKKNSDLKIVYKSKYADKVKEIQHLKERRESKDKDRDKKEKKKRRSRSRERSHSSKHKKHKRETSEERRRRKAKEKKKLKEKKREEERKQRRDSKEDKKVKKEEEPSERKEEPKERTATPEVTLPPKKSVLKEQQQNNVFKSKPEFKSESEEPEQELDIDSDDGDSDGWKPPAQPVPKKTTAPKRRPSQSVPTRPAKRGRRKRADSSDSDGAPQIDSIPRQCLAPTCINSNRVGSKYCSDDCGMALAQLRMSQILPERIMQWNATPCRAQEIDNAKLKVILQKQDDIKDKYMEQDRLYHRLEEIIENSKCLEIDEDEESDSDDEEEAAEMRVHCVTCGQDILTSTAIKHMERCYNKEESQTSFASRFKSQIASRRLFCDYYNRKDQTYCKRLEVLCPEHHPDPRIGDHDVCGYPLAVQLFDDQVSGYCLRAKKNCHKHIYWEKLQRAQIDMERIRLIMKGEELMEQERTLRTTMSSRGNVLGLLLHCTIDHEWVEKREKEMMKARKQHMAAQKMCK